MKIPEHILKKVLLVLLLISFACLLFIGTINYVTSERYQEKQEEEFNRIIENATN